MIFTLIVVLVASALSVITAYLIVAEDDLLVSCVYLALFGVFYALIYYAFMAPDVVLAYIPISSIIVPAMFFTVLSKLGKRQGRPRVGQR
ncbi:MAG: hydrogenase subunit MbhD domain-containing protein [Desulfurococcaceae archaeon]